MFVFRFDLPSPKWVCGIASLRLIAVVFYGGEQFIAGKWFPEISHAAGGLGLGARSRLVMCGDERKRQRWDFRMKFALQLKDRNAAKLNVRHHNTNAMVRRVVKKSLGGEIGPHHITRRAQQAAQGLAHAFVIVNDGDKGRDFRHLASMTERPDEKV